MTMNEDDGVALFLSSKYDELGGLTFYNFNQVNETIQYQYENQLSYLSFCSCST